MPSVLANEDQSPEHVSQEMQDPAPDADASFVDLSEQRIRVLPGASDTAASFQFEAEGHTLGNALRHIIMKNPEVEFCGYSIPHPLEAKMNLRIQTYDGTTVYDALEQSFDDLMELCGVVTTKFTIARDEFNERLRT